MEGNYEICGLRIDIGNISSFIALTEKGAHCINNTYQGIGNSWEISAGTRDNIKSRARYVNSKTTGQGSKRKSSGSHEVPKKLGSGSLFDFKTYCQ